MTEPIKKQLNVKILHNLKVFFKNFKILYQFLKKFKLKFSKTVILTNNLELKCQFA